MGEDYMLYTISLFQDALCFSLQIFLNFFSSIGPMKFHKEEGPEISSLEDPFLYNSNGE